VEASKALQDDTVVDQTGLPNLDDKTFPLTFITGLNLKNYANHPVMREEIFGPVLPIVTVSSPSKALELINKIGPTPLTQYIFSSDREVIKQLSQINAGNLLVNDTILNGAIESLPFGGVGMSGMGKDITKLLGSYHGKYSLETFTRKQAVLTRSIKWEFLNHMRYPHVSGNVESIAYKIFTMLLVNSTPPSWFRMSIERFGGYLQFVAVFAVGILLGLLAARIS
jgi:Aldehyde dehydrogenase family